MPQENIMKPSKCQTKYTQISNCYPTILNSGKKNVFYGSLRRWKQKDCEFRFLGYTVKGCPQNQGFGDVIQ
jgi:hypothetical protein